MSIQIKYARWDIARLPKGIFDEDSFKPWKGILYR